MAVAVSMVGAESFFRSSQVVTHLAAAFMALAAANCVPK